LGIRGIPCQNFLQEAKNEGKPAEDLAATLSARTNSSFLQSSLADTCFEFKQAAEEPCRKHLLALTDSVQLYESFLVLSQLFLQELLEPLFRLTADAITTRREELTIRSLPQHPKLPQISVFDPTYVDPG